MVRVALVEPQQPADTAFVRELTAAPDVRLRRVPQLPAAIRPDLIVVYLVTFDERACRFLLTLRQTHPGPPLTVAVRGHGERPNTVHVLHAAVRERSHADAAHAAATAAVGRLSPSELQLLGLIADGRTNPEIGQHLGLAAQTVKNYVSALFTKLGVSRRTEAAVLFVRATADRTEDSPGPAGRSGGDVAELISDVQVRLDHLSRAVDRIAGVGKLPATPLRRRRAGSGPDVSRLTVNRRRTG